MADVMTRDAASIGPNELAAEAVLMMEKHSINGLSVLDESGRLVGRAERPRPAARGGDVTPPAEIALVVLDVDGVLTDGRLWYGPDGESLKAFHVRDGHGIKMLVAAGVGVAVISGPPLGRGHRAHARTRRQRRRPGRQRQGARARGTPEAQCH